MVIQSNRLDENNLPFIQESFTNNIVKLKSFIHNNIYADQTASNILENIIKESFDPFNVELEMDRHFKTINLKLKKTNIKKIINDETAEKYNSISRMILQIFFSNEYIQELLKQYNDPFKYNLQNESFLNLLFNVTIISDNLIKIYL